MTAWLKHPGLTRQEFTNPTTLAWKREPALIVLHSTEGGGYPSATTYRSGRSAPHLTVDPRERTARQHYPLTEAAWALAAPAGVSTNTLGAVQVEIIGTCDPRRAGRPSVLTFDDGDLTYLAGILRAIADATGIPLASSVEWVGYPSSYGANGARLTAAQWATYRGVLGHQHVPGNTHGDPGTLNVARLLELAGGVVTAPPSTSPSPAAPSPKGYAARGDTGALVLEVQSLLGLTADGIYGPLTERAVSDYQASRGLTVDGITGPQTLTALRSGAPAHTAALAVDGDLGPLTTQALQRALGVTADGITGPVTVRALQARVGATADGVWGPQTTRALQRHLGVTVDGVAGPQTVSELQRRLNAGTF